MVRALVVEGRELDTFMVRVEGREEEEVHLHREEWTGVWAQVRGRKRRKRGWLRDRRAGRKVWRRRR